ncbi:hypothetical protein K0I73_05350 [Shewanella mesophila]|uniref:hypothetical protein n=1 Tax=Shewanella mesophila TaxID=2864208 RepID=UPI001C6567C3|nr:hypothetical protein [Shewanella mesophila]QYJ87146.1 hypothetical protein K0I73_05350 [Shewanella mesophila]
MIVKWWRAYITWCDKMGLTQDNKRCCVPNLSDPPLKKTRKNAEPSVDETKDNAK